MAPPVGEGGGGYWKWRQKVTRGVRGNVTQYSDVTISIFHTDHLFYLFIIINQNS